MSYASVISCLGRRLFLLATLSLLAAPGAFGAEAIDGDVPARMPSTIQISSELKATFDQMVTASPTFRQQLARIVAAPRLVITAHVDPAMSSRSYRARSCIRRYDSGLLVVAITIGPGHHAAEWIAHEFEHVIEQLEGVKVSRLADRWQSGVWFSGDAMVETARAGRAGRRVWEEMSGRHGAQTSLWSRQAQ